jgi:hypothetical protein
MKTAFLKRIPKIVKQVKIVTIWQDIENIPATFSEGVSLKPASRNETEKRAIAAGCCMI